MVARPLASVGERGKNGRLPFASPRFVARRFFLSTALAGAGTTLLLLLAGPPLAGGARSDPMAEGPQVRVLLLEGPLITVGAAGSSGLRLRDQEGRPLLDVGPGHQLRVRRSGARLALEPLPGGPGTGGTAASPTAGDLAPPGEGEAAASPRQVPLQELRLEPIDPRGLLVLKQRRYRGQLLLRAEGEGLLAINHLPLESYLAGVVGSEMPSSWPQAALRAQAVASRTYALHQLRPDAPFDLKSTVASQVYKGVEAETSSVREAVASTRAQVLMYGDRLINAVFHSSSGGLTENSGDLWSRQLPYLVSVPDDDTASPGSRWEKTFPPEALRQAFQEIGGALTIQPLQTSRSGRLRQVKVVGPGGELVLSGSALRERLGLRSTLVNFRFEPAGPVGRGASFPPFLTPPPSLPGESASAAAAPLTAFASREEPAAPALRLVVDGRGYGHGVGMSQWGAYGLALRGKSHEDILRHYYRGAVLRSW